MAKVRPRRILRLELRDSRKLHHGESRDGRPKRRLKLWRGKKGAAVNGWTMSWKWMGRGGGSADKPETAKSVASHGWACVMRTHVRTSVRAKIQNEVIRARVEAAIDRDAAHKTRLADSPHRISRGARARAHAHQLVSMINELYRSRVILSRRAAHCYRQGLRDFKNSARGGEGGRPGILQPPRTELLGLGAGPGGTDGVGVRIKDTRQVLLAGPIVIGISLRWTTDRYELGGLYPSYKLLINYFWSRVERDGDFRLVGACAPMPLHSPRHYFDSFCTLVPSSL
jgi:hypothetical protein